MTNEPINLTLFHEQASQAALRIAPYIYATPLEYSPYLSELAQAEVYLKCECLQKTGSFKLRGAANFILSLPETERAKGLVTASTGNHAAAFGYMVDRLRLDGTIYLPVNSAKAKLEALKNYKVTLELYGHDCLEAESQAIEIAEQNGQIYLSPYNHLDIITGQGTVGLEIIEELGTIDKILCPVGGGGLASGLAAVIKQVQPEAKIIGCQPENSKVMFESIQAGRILDLTSRPSLADGTAGGIEQGSITFDYCRELLDNFLIVTEDEIRSAMRLIIEKHQLLIEGAAALSVAGFIKSIDQYVGKKVVLILSGRKISLENLQSVIAED